MKEVRLDTRLFSGEGRVSEFRRSESQNIVDLPFLVLNGISL